MYFYLFPCQRFFFFFVVVFFSSQPPPEFWSFSQNFNGPQNTLLYEYLNMQYVKRKNRASAFKQTNEQKHFVLCAFFLSSLGCGQSNILNKKLKKLFFRKSFQNNDQITDEVG